MGIVCVTWSEVDDLASEIENLRYEPERASEVAKKFKELVRDVARFGLDEDL